MEIIFLLIIYSLIWGNKPMTKSEANAARRGAYCGAKKAIRRSIRRH